MLQILTVTFPFFALVLAGYTAARARLLPLEAIPGLNTFVLYFALPCMLYRFGAQTPIDRLLDARVAGVWLACGLLVVAAVVALTRRRHGWNDAAFGALVAAFPNTGFMGVPLLVALVGPASAGPVIVIVVVDMVVTSSVCIALSRLDGVSGAGVALRGALGGVLRNPMPWAIAAGAVVSATQAQVWGPLDKTVGLMADAASPVALFTIGTVLARSQMRAASGDRAAPAPRDHVPVALVKLVVHPALLWVAGWGALALGLPLDDFTRKLMVMVAALPSASNVSMLAERFGADNGRIARIILVSTAAAFLSFSAVVSLLK